MTYIVSWKEYGGEWIEYETGSVFVAIGKFLWARFCYPLVAMACGDTEAICAVDFGEVSE